MAATLWSAHKNYLNVENAYMNMLASPKKYQKPTRLKETVRELGHCEKPHCYIVKQDRS